MESKGYIVITSVSTPEAVDEIESKAHGYVRALVLDPSEVCSRSILILAAAVANSSTQPETATLFLRSLSSTLSRRFPITAAGDPHAHPSTHTYIQSIVSLLTLPPQDQTPPIGPLEHLSLRDSYLPYLQSTHIAPLRVIQGLLPYLRTTPARAQDALSNNLGQKSIIVCLPVTDNRVGLPFVSTQAMSAAATQRAVDVLRRELQVSSAARTSAALRNIKVVTVDVGAIGHSAAVQKQNDAANVLATMDYWSAGEREVYGSAFTNLATSGSQLGIARQPSDLKVFVDAIGRIIKDGRDETGYNLPLYLSKIKEWLHGHRVIVGAGGKFTNNNVHLCISNSNLH